MRDQHRADARRRGCRTGTKVISISRRRSLHEVELPGLPALHRSRPRDRGRPRGDAAGADRGRQEADHRRSPARCSQERGAKLREATAAVDASARARTRRYGWDASPISTARLSAEMWERDRRRGLVARQQQHRLDRRSVELRQVVSPHRRLRPAAGQGYGPPAAVGAALANKKHGRLSVEHRQRRRPDVRRPGSFWTAAHHRIPLLTVMHNNRAYHQEVMHIQRMANRAPARHRRRAHRHASSRIRTSTTRSSRRAWACTGEGPITNPKDLGPALKRALAVVKKGEPALVDVVTQPR